MTDEDFKNKLIDRFEGFELIELLNVSIEEVIEAFSDKIDENLAELQEFIVHGR